MKKSIPPHIINKLPATAYINKLPATAYFFRTSEIGFMHCLKNV